MSTVISVENVSKAYRLGTIGGATLKEDVGRWWAKVRSKPDPLSKIGQEHHARRMGEQFWALQNVSFEVKEGEVLGIIGRNGAGKSSLLKILSQVTAPTSGEIKVKGRIASLLEVGTGFHPELTGRENIFLNGAILGMTKAEIRKKFDEIVAFSDIEEFIDTPVKRYSSGMYVRLAFAVAAHLEPEILIIDEVLAVGDAAFQKKCISKMGEAARGGRTVIFVSHNMVAVQTLCNRCILLEDGALRIAGAPEKLTEYYLGLGAEAPGSFRSFDEDQQPGSPALRITAVRVTPLSNNGSPIGMRTPILIELSYRRFSSDKKMHLTIHLQNEQDVTVLSSGTGCLPEEAGTYTAHCQIPGDLLNTGTYMIHVFIVEDGARVVFLGERLATFKVIDECKRQLGWMGREPGVIQPRLTWHIASNGERKHEIADGSCPTASGGRL